MTSSFDALEPACVSITGLDVSRSLAAHRSGARAAPASFGARSVLPNWPTGR
ncbi:hypothetical protein [Paraburkholderia ginsengisoli]|uniref:Uncharacterized protein n=1 Tax=Paraburkholderia ginsengisoli TaxID=311231 RepID=A0A7T4N955_9BURK|nr:hypothetical protein [Paraburkholderia ginsengisoli]QQC67507.1 hypothetical protein I6I06_21550 [Paraburkholderia ginsengisoli]